MKYIVYILLFFPVWVTAQTYKYIGIEDGLSNRRIFNIQKDAQGYMWFLTNEGMDRYNGKDIKHYKLNKEGTILDAPIRLGWLYTEPHIGIWVVGKQGRVFQYEADRDDFKMVYKLPDTSEAISCGYLDRNDNIWICRKDTVLLYNIKDAHIVRFPNVLHSSITAIEQVDEHHFFIATETGVRYVKLENGILETMPVETLDYFHAQVSELYFHRQLKRLFIGSFERGVFVYDMNTQEIIRPDADLSDVNIARISPLNETELLIATEGMGVYKVNVNTCELEDYIIANYQSYNEMNGNNINDVFVDEEKRIWLANYPTGITVIDNRYENYHWMKHAMGNAQSLINDQVQAVIEDHEGDLWFGTSNGISLYNSKTGQWHSFLSSFNHQLKDKNHIFITLCEVAPGIIWAGGYTSGIYKINKETLSVEYFSPYLLSHVNMRPDKYIRDIVKDSRGHIWSGGYYNLKCFDLETNSARLYPGLNSITSIVEKDKDNMWIGTAAGLYLLNRNTGEYQYIEMEIGITYINTLYQADNGLLYIGTNGMGVFIYNPQDKTFEHYFSDNSALVSNRIFTILPEVDGRIMMSTENGITCFHTKEKIFRNWTRGEGLLPAYFNAAAGTVRKNKNFVFGSTDGAIELPMNVKFPDYKFSRLVFSDFHLSYQPVERILSEQGRIDVLINNAGIGIGGALELATEEEVNIQMNTNFFGVVNMCKAVLPSMRKARKGKIINISSIGGVMGIPYQGFYSASKFAVEGYSEALALEVYPFHIKVCVVEPGDFNTGFTDNRNISEQTRLDADYGESFLKSLEIIEKEERNGCHPRKLGAAICKIVECTNPPFRTKVGPWIQVLFAKSKKWLPDAVMQCALRIFYAIK